MNIEQISSRQNDTIKLIVKLRDRSKRDKTGLFIVEGYRELSRAIECYKKFESIYFCSKFFKNSNYENLLKTASQTGINLVSVTDIVYEKISIRSGYDGLLGLCKEWDTNLNNIQLSNNPLVLVAESIEKAGNLGALIRSAESVGADALIVCDQVTDIFNQNVVRASQGAVFSLPIAVTDRQSTCDFLKEHRISILATTPSAMTKYWSCYMKQPIAILVGSEDFGLSEFWLKNSNVTQVAIPQLGVSDSLNVNDAAVVVMYEALRQRMS